MVSLQAAELLLLVPSILLVVSTSGLILDKRPKRLLRNQTIRACM